MSGCSRSSHSSSRGLRARMPLTLNVALFTKPALPAPPERSRGASDREAGPAAAARGRIGVGHLEGRAAKILDEIYCRSLDQVEADRIDDEPDAIGLGNCVTHFGGA